MIVKEVRPVPPHREQHAENGYDMAEDWYFVRLDLERIRRVLSQEDRTTYALEYVTQWLKDAGFHPKNAGWLVRAEDLGQVQPTEVTSIEEWRGPTPS